MESNRQQNIDRFYSLLDKVIEKFPKQTLDIMSKDRLPEKGVYFFFEQDELRNDSNIERVVRIGTHAAIKNSNATLYDRLYNHKGSKDLSGNHRGSVFRKLIGESLINRDTLDYPYWGDRTKKKDKLVKLSEKPLEKIVSSYLHTLTYTVLEIPGISSKDNDRAFIEENSIALLSNYQKTKIDQNSKKWLGLYSNNHKVIESGLWNSDCVERKNIDGKYFEKFEKYLSQMHNY